MKASQIVNQLLNQGPELRFHSLLTDSSRMRSAVNRLNEIVIEEPQAKNVVIGLTLYPAFTWLSTCYGTEQAGHDVQLEKLSQIQGMLHEVSGLRPVFQLKEREKYIALVRNLVSLVEGTIRAIESYPRFGVQYFEALNTLFYSGDTEETFDNEPSRYIMKRYLKPAIKALATNFGSLYDEAVETLFAKNMIGDSQFHFVYHNTELLLREYITIIWRESASEDKAVKLLLCESEEEMLAITSSDRKYTEASYIVEFMRVIQGAIELVRTYPKNGEEYHEILQWITDKESIGVLESELAKRLGLSHAAFSQRKKRAIKVLSFILWGCDSDELLSLIIEG